MFAIVSNNIGFSYTWYLFDLESNTILGKQHAPSMRIGSYSFLKELYKGQSYTVQTMQYTDMDRLFIIDYDGDGNHDICHISNRGTDVYRFTTIHSTYYLAPEGNTYTELSTLDLQLRTLLVGELNGDGKEETEYRM